MYLNITNIFKIMRLREFEKIMKAVFSRLECELIEHLPFLLFVILTSGLCPLVFLWVFFWVVSVQPVFVNSHLLLSLSAEMDLIGYFIFFQ